MIDSSFVEKIIKESQTTTVQIGGKDYSSRPVYNAPREEIPLPKALGVSTLTAVLDYIFSGQAEAKELFLHVESPTTVRVFGKLDALAQRACYLKAEACTKTLQLNRWMQPDSFIVNLMAGCVDNDDSDKMTVLAYVGNITEEHVKKTRDDGVTQGATVKTGITLTDTVECPNPVNLQPYRTFTEVDQPISKFVLRLQDGPEAALFEADGGAWQVEAIQRISEFLNNALLKVQDDLKEAGLRVTVLA